MTKLRDIGKTTLVNLYYFLIFLPLAAFIWSLASGGEARLYLLLPLAVPFFLTEWLRLRVRAAALFFLAHFALIPAVYFAAGLVDAPRVYVGGLGDVDIYTLLCAAMTAVFAVYSITLRLKNIKEDMESKNVVFAAVYGTALYMGAGAAGNGAARPVILACGFLILLVYILYTHLQAVDRSLGAITMTTTQPVKKILSVTNRLIFIFIAFSALIMLAFMLFGADGLLSYAGSFLLYALRSLLTRLFRGGAAAEAELQPPAMPAGDMSGMLAFFQDARPQNPVMAFLEKIFAPLAFTILGILAAVGVSYAVYRAIKSFNEGKPAKPAPGEEKGYLMPDLVEKVKPGFKWFDFAPVNRTRRAFYKKVARHIRQGVKIDESDTAPEIALKIRPQEDIGGLAADYEKVRYSDLE